MNYQHSRNKVFLIQYHLVWCPKIGNVSKETVKKYIEAQKGK